MKKALPIGVVNYREIQYENYYTVDKTMMIQEFLERKSKVTLITRPRRFGKTSNMSMLAEFFDITKSSKQLFEKTNISGSEYISQMNQYPVIFLSFANAKGNLTAIVKAIKEEVKDAYKKYQFVLEDINFFDQPYYQVILNGLGNPEDGDIANIDNAVSFLMKKLEEYYHKKVIILIDEYDTPFIEAHVHGFYHDIRAGLSSLLHNALKDNDSLQYAMLTGIQRVAKENAPQAGRSLFSDLNNLKVFTVQDKEYAQWFGFTETEVRELLKYYDLSYSDEVKAMYDGYHIGDFDMYNPWSIINYVDEKELKPYWVNTSSNTMIKNAMEQSDRTFKKGYEKLLEQGWLDTQVSINTSFYEQSNTENLWGLFVNAGYLTIDQELPMKKVRIRIPNQEVQEEFMSLTAYYLHVSDTLLNDLFAALLTEDEAAFLETYRTILLTLPSYYDLKNENSFHMMMLGMCAWLSNDYTISSNREKGKGRSDIELRAKTNRFPSFVMEMKYMKTEEYKKHPEALKVLAQEGLQQIQKQTYDIDLTGKVIYISLAHAGKDVEMIWQKSSIE